MKKSNLNFYRYLLSLQNGRRYAKVILLLSLLLLTQHTLNANEIMKTDPLDILESSIVAQSAHKISGKVTDEYGDPLPGVTVLIKNTKTATMTDGDGLYSIEASGNSILVLTYIGMKSIEVSVGNKNTLDITMTNDAIGLDPAFVGTEEGLLFNMNLGSTIEDRTGKFTALGTSIVWEDQ